MKDGEKIMELDWCQLGQPSRDDRLHHGTWDDPSVWDEDGAGPGVTACGIVSSWLMIPGVFSRLGSSRCVDCCQVLGYPTGTGSPNNDESCRLLMRARISGE